MNIKLISAVSAAVCVSMARTFAFASEPAGTSVRFAFITDTHLSVDSPAVDDFRRCLADVNGYKELDFVIFGGDITDFGTDREIKMARTMMDSLRVPYYVVQGNHDANWSESGCNTFKNEFGYERFTFKAGGWRFIGCNSGPDMRMAPGLVPRETMKWLESLEEDEKSIFINHYPMDSSVLNYFDVTKELKRLDVRFAIGGHWHRDVKKNYQGIPAVLCRSSLSAGSVPGYTVVRLEGDHISFSERRLYGDTAVEFEPWCSRTLKRVEDSVVYDEDGLPDDYPWMRYSINARYPQVREVWKKVFDANIAAGFAVKNNVAYFPLASGEMKAVSIEDGHEIWSATFPGKIYSTPAVSGNLLVFGCSDGNVYALATSDGKVKWTYKTGKSVLGSPLIMNDLVYIGGSDGAFRALNLKDGKAVWTYTGVEGHIVSTPYGDDSRVVFGSWGRSLYSLDPRTGREQWVWHVKRPSRMFSPASCVPLCSSGRIFVAVPDRKVYVLDAADGKELFRVDGGRDAIGLSEDGSTVFSKVMFGRAYAFPADVKSPSGGGQLPDGLKTWEVRDSTGYDIAPTALVEKDGVLYIPTDKGNIVALRSSDGKFLWAHKFSSALVNPIKVLTKKGKSFILASAMDGTVSLMQILQ
ncbi:MAG: PQQ-binding-like beta-propeller repeat protein [Candidatus Cryptobacteroides sp.]